MAYRRLKLFDDSEPIAIGDNKVVSVKQIRGETIIAIGNLKKSVEMTVQEWFILKRSIQDIDFYVSTIELKRETRL